MAKIRGTRGDDYISAENDEGRRDYIFGLGGDDRFIFKSLRDQDRYDGGGGDDALLGVDFYLPMRSAVVDRGLSFDGGRGWDTIEMHLTVDRHDLTGRLDDLYGKLKSVEERLVTVTLDAQGRRPLDDFRLFGSGTHDTLTLELDGGTKADDVSLRMGKGNDDVTVDDAIRDLRIDLGRGHDRYENDTFGSGASGRDRTFVSGGAGSDDFHLGGTVERISGGGGDDVIRLGLNTSGYASDVVSGGRGADDFVFRFWDATRELAEIGDFRSGVDRLVMDSYVLFPHGASVDLPLAFGRPDYFSNGFTYDRTAGSLYWEDDHVLQFDPGTRIAQGDLIGTYDYDTLI